MGAKTTIAIVGAGNLGCALAVSLHEAGYKIAEIVGRQGGRYSSRTRALAKKLGAQLRTLDDTLSADLLWFTVPDREIAACAGRIAQRRRWTGRWAFHSSGALTSDELKALGAQGASVAAVHPLMTFVRSVRPELTDVPFALEGDAAALRLARTIVHSLGGLPFSIGRSRKAAYHAWGAFVSPLLIALLVTAERVADAVGVSSSSARKMMLPILRQTLSNYASCGPSAAFSGPIVRGDVETIRKHLKSLSKIPEARNVYVSLARSALRDLPTPGRRVIARVLGKK